MIFSIRKLGDYVLTCKEVAARLNVSRQAAMRLMKTQMKTINIGTSPDNPRLVVTEDEFQAWIHRSAKIQEPIIIGKGVKLA